MARMTDEEADRLDEKWTKNPPKPGPNGTGFYTRRKAELSAKADAKADAKAAERDTETGTITLDSKVPVTFPVVPVAGNASPAPQKKRVV
jgi:hypothetical protein